MSDFSFSTPLHGSLSVPGDKSISHRAVMFGSLADGTTRIRHFLDGADCLSTIHCFEKMGIPIEREQGKDGAVVLIHGKGLHGLTCPGDILNCGNSGTTMRLLSGILAGQPFSSVLTGDASLQKRPMKRILDPLSQMGAVIDAADADPQTAPLSIHPAVLHGIVYSSPVSSAQVKSCILLAGLYAEGNTTVQEPVLSRDHTERMLQQFGANLSVVQPTDSNEIEVYGTAKQKMANPTDTPSLPQVTLFPDAVLSGIDLTVPGDISSAAYFLVAASIVPGSEVLLENVGINPTRDGILRVLQEMGADISVENVRFGSEPSADLLVRSAPLHATVIEGDLIPALIDELPVLAIAAACAEGETVIRDAAELKVKESDRITLVVDGLQRLGVDAVATEDGMRIRGGTSFCGATVETAGDHRIAMSFAIADLLAKGDILLSDASCVAVSYPEFFTDLRSLL